MTEMTKKHPIGLSHCRNGDWTACSGIFLGTWRVCGLCDDQVKESLRDPSW